MTSDLQDMDMEVKQDEDFEYGCSLDFGQDE